MNMESDSRVRKIETTAGESLGTASLLATLAAEAQAGYLAKPWGGVELGGLLLGTHEGDTITVWDRVVIDCEHEFGPAFELSEGDRQALVKLLARLETQNSDHKVVGWYRTTSKYLSMTEADTALADEFFGRPGQLTVIIQRGRNQEPLFGFFRKEPDGVWKYAAEFCVEESTTEPDTASNVADIPAKQTENDDAAMSGEVVEHAGEHTGVVNAAPPPAQDPARDDLKVLAGALQPTPEAAEPKNEVAPAVGTTVPNVVEPASPSLIGRREDSIASLRPPLTDREPHLVHFGFKEDPFALTPDPRYWYPSATHREAAATLLYGIQARKACMAMIGEAGSGKTFVLEYVTDALKVAGIEFAFLFNSHLTVEQFFELVAVDLELPCESYRKVQVLLALQERVMAAAERGSTVAILIDNAHKLSAEVLEEIDLLGNLESRRVKLLQVVLAGQPELDAKLEKAGLRSLRQRIALRATLSRLSQAETTAYIHARLQQAAAPDLSLFPEPIIGAVWERTSGLPRFINSVCSALLERTFTQKRVMTLELVDEVARDLGFTPAGVPFRETPAATIKA